MQCSQLEHACPCTHHCSHQHHPAPLVHPPSCPRWHLPAALLPSAPGRHAPPWLAASPLPATSNSSLDFDLGTGPGMGVCDCSWAARPAGHLRDSLSHRLIAASQAYARASFCLRTPCKTMSQPHFKLHALDCIAACCLLLAVCTEYMPSCKPFALLNHKLTLIAGCCLHAMPDICLAGRLHFWVTNMTLIAACCHLV